jgi:putative CocE/NonD family hydrolase
MRRSSLGVYEGFGNPVADGYVRRSRYLEIEDGCRLAIDIIRPALGGVELEGRLPTLVHATGYRRAYLFGETDRKLMGDTPGWKRLEIGELVTAYEKTDLGKRMVDHGYNIVSVDLRGTGASFGTTHSGMWRNSADIAQVIDWIAEQEWATDKVGMIGISWEGTIQLTTAAYRPRHLAAIAPMATSTGFSAFCDNGLVLSGFYNVDWSDMRRDQESQAPALPVDLDEDGSLRSQAQRERAAPPPAVAPNDPLAPMRVTRDGLLASVAEGAPPPPMLEAGPLRDSLDEVARINASNTAVLLVSGWWDISFSGHVLDFYRALTVPKRLLMGPWNHLGPNCSAIEQHRWFDHWLKGIDNGINREVGFQFASVDAFGEERWHGAPDYPLRETRERLAYLQADGTLGPGRPGKSSALEYLTDYSVTMGTHSRSRFFFRERRRIIPPDLNDRATRCLSFLSAPYAAGAELNGRAELVLKASTSGTSGAVVVTLEEILADGRAVYITEGWLNLFHRAVSDSERPHDGRGFHRQDDADILDVVPGKAMELAIELYPVAWRLQAGSRVRLTIAGSDADNLLVVPADPAPTLSVVIGGDFASRLYLPVVDAALPSTAVTDPTARFHGRHSRAFDYLTH